MQSWGLLGAALWFTTDRLATATVDVRVSKAFYTRPYDMVRLSVISENKADGSAETPSLGPTAYRSPFRHRWTTKTLHSQLVSVGKTGTFVPIGGGEELHIKLPAPGSKVTGLFFSDPCFTSKGGFKCPNGRKFRVLERLTEVLNRLVASDEFHFWGILGDIFYDVLGGVSSEFFSRLSLQVKSKPFLAVVGNHDLWLGGQPPGGPGDQLGYGFMQFYGQDTVAGLGTVPYNFDGDPDKLQIAQSENFIFGTQIGDMAFFGFSAAHDWLSTKPHALAFCAWAGKEATVQAILVLGHWDKCDLGCKEGMDTPSVFWRMKAMPGCSSKRMLSFAGHQHCNRAMNSSNPLDAVSFVVGGAGMYGPGCSQFGFTVVQSRSGVNGVPDVQVDHFPIAQEDFAAAGVGNGVLMRPAFWNSPPSYDRYEALARCLARRGYGGCRADHGQSLRAVSMQEIVTPQEISASGEIIRDSNQVPASVARVAPAPLPPPLPTVAPVPPPPPLPPRSTTTMTTITITTPSTATITTTATTTSTKRRDEVLVIPFPATTTRFVATSTQRRKDEVLDIPFPATTAGVVPVLTVPPVTTRAQTGQTIIPSWTRATTSHRMTLPFNPGSTTPRPPTQVPSTGSSVAATSMWTTTSPAASIQTVETAGHMNWTPPPLPPLAPNFAPTFPPGSAGEGYASTTPTTTKTATTTTTVTTATASDTTTTSTTSATTVTTTTTTTTAAATMEEVQAAAVLRTRPPPPPPPPDLSPTIPPGVAAGPVALTTGTTITTPAPMPTNTSTTHTGSSSTVTTRTTTITTATTTTLTTATTTHTTHTVTIPMHYPTYPPAQAPSLSPSRHNCWHGLHDPGVLWSWEQADWCCRELQLGCHKVASTTTTTQSTSTLTSSTTTRTTKSGQASKHPQAQAQLDGVLKGKSTSSANSGGGRNADGVFVPVDK